MGDIDEISFRSRQGRDLSVSPGYLSSYESVNRVYHKSRGNLNNRSLPRIELVGTEDLSDFGCIEVGQCV